MLLKKECNVIESKCKQGKQHFLAFFFVKSFSVQN